jgi:hypothetical protein
VNINQAMALRKMEGEMEFLLCFCFAMVEEYLRALRKNDAGDGNE